MQLSKLLSKLRADHARIAAAIEILTPYVETEATAKKILKAIRPRKYRKRGKHSVKGFKYAAGSHWTQRPENKEKLAAMRVKQAASRKAAKRG